MAESEPQSNANDGQSPKLTPGDEIMADFLSDLIENEDYVESALRATPGGPLIVRLARAVADWIIGASHEISLAGGHEGLSTDSIVRDAWDSCTDEEKVQVQPFLAEVLSTGASGSGRGSYELIRDFLADTAIQKLVAVRAYDRMILRTHDAAYERIPELARRLIDRDLSASAQEYLRRVAEMYIWGFDDAVAIFARATLEAVVTDSLSDEEVAALVGRPLREPALGDRLRAARTKRLLDADGYLLANRIRLAGNDAVHVQPGGWTVFANALEVIDALRVVLKQLCPRT